MVTSLLICCGASLGVSSSTQRRIPSRICLASNAWSGGRAVINESPSLCEVSGEARRRHEPAEILLDQFGKPERRAILEPGPDQLHADRQPFRRERDRYRC